MSIVNMGSVNEDVRGKPVGEVVQLIADEAGISLPDMQEAGDSVKLQVVTEHSDGSITRELLDIPLNDPKVVLVLTTIDVEGVDDPVAT